MRGPRSLPDLSKGSIIDIPSGAPDGVLHSATPALCEKSRGDGRQTSSIICKITPIISTDYQKIVCELLRGAHRSIDICAYTWKWYAHQSGCLMQQINRTIIEKARQGVKVRVRLNSEQKDHYLTKENSLTSNALRRYPILTKFDNTGTTSHLKMIIIDNEIVIIGSHNLTKRSVSQNHETSVAIYGEEACRDFVKYFGNLWIVR